MSDSADNKKEAQRIRHNYSRRYKRKRVKCRIDGGDRWESIHLAAEMHNKLWDLGYRIEEGGGPLIEVTEEYIAQLKANEKESARLMKKAGITNDPDDRRAAIRALSMEIDFDK